MSINTLLNNGAYNTFRKQQDYINRVINPPALQMIKEQQGMMNQILNSPGMASIFKENNSFSRMTSQASTFAKLSESISQTNLLYEKFNSIGLNSDFSKINGMFNNYFESNSLVDKIAHATESVGLASMFKDVTLESLEAFNELDDIFPTNSKDEHPQNDTSELSGSLTVRKPKLVSEMTVDELEEMLRTGQSATNKELNAKDRIKSFLSEVMKNYGIDIAKAVASGLIQFLFILIWSAVISNHNADVSNTVSTFINENEQITKVRKVFINNPNIEQPIGNMAFLRVSSQLRQGTSKGAPLVSQDVVSKNTVVLPIEKKGNWIKVQVETINGCYFGWIEESKVIKFKLEK
jgi:hypothetical protein